ncbi:hypothetical protein BG004_007576, partial [Podila humilis]
MADPPCSKPIKEDIVAAINMLTPHDRNHVCPRFFDLGLYNQAHDMEEAQSAENLELRNTGGHWNDKCTSIGVFCGSNIFGCNTLDNARYECDAIGGKPKLVEVCHGETVRCDKDTNKCAGPDPDCLCKSSGRYCSNIYFAQCDTLKDNTLYTCDGSGFTDPVEKKVCGMNEVCSTNGGTAPDCHSCGCTAGKAK